MSAQQSLVELEGYVMGVFDWMTQAKFNLNPRKTKFLLIGSVFQRKKFSHLSPLPILDNQTDPADSAMRPGSPI